MADMMHCGQPLRERQEPAFQKEQGAVHVVASICQTGKPLRDALQEPGRCIVATPRNSKEPCAEALEAVRQQYVECNEKCSA